jgi:hypothetical protein
LLPSEVGAHAALSAALRPQGRAAGMRSQQLAAAEGEQQPEEEEEEDDDDDEEEGPRRKGGAARREAAGVRRMRATLLRLFGTEQERAEP